MMDKMLCLHQIDDHRLLEQINDDELLGRLDRFSTLFALMKHLKNASSVLAYTVDIYINFGRHTSVKANI